MEVGFRVLEEAVAVGVFLEVPELQDLGRFLLSEFWLARVAGDLHLLLCLSYALFAVFHEQFQNSVPSNGYSSAKIPQYCKPL